MDTLERGWDKKKAPKDTLVEKVDLGVFPNVRELSFPEDHWPPGDGSTPST